MAQTVANEQKLSMGRALYKVLKERSVGAGSEWVFCEIIIVADIQDYHDELIRELRDRMKFMGDYHKDCATEAIAVLLHKKQEVEAKKMAEETNAVFGLLVKGPQSEAQIFVETLIDEDRIKEILADLEAKGRVEKTTDPGIPYPVSPVWRLRR